MKKKVKVHMLPTKDNTNLIFDNKNGNLFYTTSKNVPLNYQHLYFTSDEKIEVGDYITDGYRVWQWKDDCSLLGRRKIVTTNNSLIGPICDGKCAKYECVCIFPQIPQSFIKQYVEAGGKINEIEIEYKEYGHYEMAIDTFNSHGYKPKVDSNNCVIIHLNEEKLYTEEDIKNALHSAELKDNKNYTNIYTVMKEYLDNLK